MCLTLVPLVLMTTLCLALEIYILLASEAAQEVKVCVHKDWKTEFDSQDPCNRMKKLTPASCPLTHMHMCLCVKF